MIGTLRPDLALLRPFDAATCRPPATASSAAPVLLQCTPHPGQSRKLASSGKSAGFQALSRQPGDSAERRAPGGAPNRRRRAPTVAQKVCNGPPASAADIVLDCRPLVTGTLAMLPPKAVFEALSQQASRLFAGESPLPKAELESQFRALMQSAFSKLDLVSREEFDSQMLVLARTRARLEALEAKVAELESKLTPPAD